MTPEQWQVQLNAVQAIVNGLPDEWRKRIDSGIDYAALSRERLAYGRTERNKALAEAALLIRNNTRGLQGQAGMYEDIANVLAGWVEGMVEP